MSTYLLAMVVARLDFVEGYSAKGVKYRVYTMPGVTEQGMFALDVGRGLLFKCYCEILIRNVISISVGTYFYVFGLFCVFCLFCLLCSFIYLFALHEVPCRKVFFCHVEPSFFLGQVETDVGQGPRFLCEKM